MMLSHSVPFARQFQIVQGALDHLEGANDYADGVPAREYDSHTYDGAMTGGYGVRAVYSNIGQSDLTSRLRGSPTSAKHTNGTNGTDIDSPFAMRKGNDDSRMDVETTTVAANQSVEVESDGQMLSFLSNLRQRSWQPEVADSGGDSIVPRLARTDRRESSQVMPNPIARPVGSRRSLPAAGATRFGAIGTARGQH